MLPSSIRKWLAFGTGVGIEIGSRNLTVSVVRVRPAGSSVVGTHTIEDFRNRPAAEWGREYADFVKAHRARHIAAVVLAPRSELIVRTVAFPGVKDNELGAAVSYQLDSMHPYAEDDAVSAWARLDHTHVLVGILRRQLFEQYTSLFAEAGIKVVNFTFSAAAIYSSIRLNTATPKNFLSAEQTADGVELYGESEARPVFSAVLDIPMERAVPMAAAELRLPPDIEPQPLGIGMSHAAAMSSACPGLVLNANLLPEGQRRASSKLRYVPTAVLATTLAGLSIAILLHKPYEEKKYVEAMQTELQRVEPLAGRVNGLDQNLARIRQRIQRLDQFRKRTKDDLDLILEMTNTLQPPTWVNGMDVARDTLTLSGETEQASSMLRMLDNSPRLANSEFTVAISKMPAGEGFRIRSQRENTQPVALPAAQPGAQKR